jgi:hypothetical protein
MLVEPFSAIDRSVFSRSGIDEQELSNDFIFESESVGGHDGCGKLLRDFGASHDSPSAAHPDQIQSGHS